MKGRRGEGICVRDLLHREACLISNLPLQANSVHDLHKANQITSFCEWILDFTKGITYQKNYLRIPLNNKADHHNYCWGLGRSIKLAKHFPTQ